LAPKWFSAVSAKVPTLRPWALALSAAIAFVWVCLYAFTSSVLVLGGFSAMHPVHGRLPGRDHLPFRRNGVRVLADRISGGKVPVISVIGVVALTCVVFVFYRLLIDAAYGANNHLSEVIDGRRHGVSH